MFGDQMKMGDAVGIELKCRFHPDAMLDQNGQCPICGVEEIKEETSSDGVIIDLDDFIADGSPLEKRGTGSNEE